ncbi:putative lipid II flippase FtsW [Myxococcota bacterium]|nr:putative lipid II flippase FtsW [Myxococcota bacterium]MBU1534840.1 putative lipid II flippase FtsW [Myxococcota bacterium]
MNHCPTPVPQNPRLSREGWLLVFVAISLALYGLIMVFSVTAGQILARHYHTHRGLPSALPSTNRFLFVQGIFIFGGIIAMSMAAWFRPATYKKLMIPGLILAMILLAGVLVFGQSVNGARRWYRFSVFSLQPMEAAKIALIVYLAVILEKRAHIMQDMWKGFAQPMLVVGAMVFLLLKQNDFGSAVLFLTVATALLFMAGSRLYYFLMAGAVTIPLLWLYVAGGWRLSKRIIPFLYPQHFTQDAAYQIIRSLDAFGSGTVTGFGLGNGPYKMEFLPEAHTDYIAAMIGQEFGFVGTMVLLFLYALFFYSGVRIALRHRKNLFRFYVCIGITLTIILQAMINLSVVMNLIPSKGITLPFVSYGGSSILLSFLALGILLSMDRHPVRDESPVAVTEQPHTAGVKKRLLPLPS